MISINATLILQIIQFLILVYILNRLMFRPILKLIDERTRHIDDERNLLRNIEEETTTLVNKCIAIEKKARSDAGRESSLIKKEAIESAEKIYSDTRDEIALIREKAGKEVEEKLKEARLSLRDNAVILSDVIAAKVIGRRIVS